jgi:hypothetical protein
MNVTVLWLWIVINTFKDKKYKLKSFNPNNSAKTTSCFWLNYYPINIEGTFQIYGILKPSSCLVIKE